MDLKDFVFLVCAAVAIACLVWIGVDDSLIHQKTACKTLASDVAFYILIDLFYVRKENQGK